MDQVPHFYASLVLNLILVDRLHRKDCPRGTRAPRWTCSLKGRGAGWEFENMLLDPDCCRISSERGLCPSHCYSSEVAAAAAVVWRPSCFVFVISGAALVPLTETLGGLIGEEAETNKMNCGSWMGCGFEEPRR